MLLLPVLLLLLWPLLVSAVLDIVFQSLAATPGQNPSGGDSDSDKGTASGSPSASTLGAVVGSVIGGVLVIGLAVGLAAAWMRQRRGSKQQGSGVAGVEKGGAGPGAQTYPSLQPRSSGGGAVSTDSGAWPQGSGGSAATIAVLGGGSTPGARSILCYSSAANPMYGSDLAFSTVSFLGAAGASPPVRLGEAHSLLAVPPTSACLA